MNKLYMGIDTGSIYIKGVIIDEYNNILSSASVLTNGSPVESTKLLIKKLELNINLNKYAIASIGVTGSARKLIGTMLNANIIKNEIYSTTNGVLNLYPKARTIIEMGGKDFKLIELKDGIITNTSINNNCTSGTGYFISSISNKLKIPIDKINELNIETRIVIDNRCIVFAEKDIYSKLQEGYKKEEVIAGLLESIAKNYINNFLKNKIINEPIIFTGGLSKNMIIYKTLEKYLKGKIIVDNNSNFLGAYGIALMARTCPKEIVFNHDIDSIKMDTKISICNRCNKECTIVSIYKNNKLIDYWGNNCERIFSKETV